MKRLIIVFLAIAMIFTFASCDNSTPKAYDVTVRLAKHVNDGDPSVANGNADLATLERSGDVVTIEADVAKMEQTTSSAGQGEGKWLALLIDTGSVDLKNVKFNGTGLTEQDVNDAAQMVDLDGNKAKDTEFVLWINVADSEKYAEGRNITISNGDENATLTLKVVDTSADA